MSPDEDIGAAQPLAVSAAGAESRFDLPSRILKPRPRRYIGCMDGVGQMGYPERPSLGRFGFLAYRKFKV
ncbi:MAG: hypothetical protein CTY25_07495 [Methylobacterium sp.]|nr:MAG: hypothetical protein CTY25_07495 [Methylobacterium sp.]